MKIRLAFFLLFGALSSVSGGQGRGSNEPARSGLSESLDDFFTRAEAFGFSGSVIVSRGGNAILRKGYGYADRRTGTRNTPETIFGLSSGDKQIIAAGIMRLSEMGRLHVTDTLGKFFNGVPADKSGITLRQVMSHTSGIPNEYWDSHRNLTRAQFIDTVLTLPLNFAPGSDWSYSNANFWLLEEVIARVSGMPYEQFIEKELFHPAGMSSTGFPSPGWKGKVIAAYKPWTFEIPSDQEVDAQPLLTRERWNWQLMTSVDDLFKWYLALRSNKVLTAASKREMFTPVRNEYGYGWNVVPTARNTTLVHHGGAGDGVGMTATIRMWPDEDIAVIILANSTNPSITADGLGSGIESIIFGGNAALPPSLGIGSPSSRSDVGKYVLPNGGVFAILQAKDGRLVIQAMDQKAVLPLLLPDIVAPLDSGTYNRRAEHALSAAFDNNFEPFREILLPGENFDHRRAQMVNLTKRFNKLGALKRASTVFQRGYDFNGLPEIQTFIHLELERGDAIVRAVQGSDGETYFNAQPLPPVIELPLAPNAAGVLTTWNFLWSNATELSVRDVGGKTVLTLHGSRGVIDAVRE